MNEQQQIQLPDQVTLTLKTQDVGNIVSALETGAYKVVLPIIHSIQGQLLAQQIRAPIAPPPVGPGIVPDAPAAQTVDVAGA